MTPLTLSPINTDVLEIALKRANEKLNLKNQIREYTEHLEKLVEEKTRELVDAERLAAVGETVAGLAHAIKNITGGLTGGGYVLEKGIELDNKKYLQQGWEMLKGNVEKIKNVALDLLSYTKKRSPEYQFCNPNTPAEEVVDLMLPRAKENDVALEIEMDESLSDVWIDPEGIYRCLLNLVTNAIHACTDVSCSRRAGKVALKTLKKEDWAVEYQVLDNGCGMDVETEEKIFQSFFSTKGSQGTGLGLMITKKIIDEQGGTVDLETEKDKGTKFIIRIPKGSPPNGEKKTDYN
ncbi:sensor histidine kinase [Thermodesulfobacteriota bacterium]